MAKQRPLKLTLMFGKKSTVVSTHSYILCKGIDLSEINITLALVCKTHILLELYHPGKPGLKYLLFTVKCTRWDGQENTCMDNERRALYKVYTLDACMSRKIA